MKRIALLLSLLPSAAFGQVLQPDQLAAWERLKINAALTSELLNCGVTVSIVDDKGKLANRIWDTHSRRAEDLMHSIDAYVLKYSERRGASETLPAFRWRVWRQTISIGEKDARSFLNAADCERLTK